ncbi:hypothetical protein PAAG_01567 [Paracoccidioides lutzii Pb01]|uniref:DUF427 domain-containing protein n=1 Tax=Paracoccidioides lutzii (strain ATCC MYA-826 / Pb01) TaxID=502779 RepID=C1GSS2_PARBA|nr:hypothetical protein PAAG_01567 [Paracoccidioides lutzii Pb01]EEH39105.1 hypothetical protein PAAG_01567 [Paracoccidioides lutzii Pb01]
MPCATAKIGKTVLAETDQWESVEGNIYFPRSSLKDSTGAFSLVKSDASTNCPWKGKASYYNIVIAETGTVISEAAWYYAEPHKAAQNIKDYVAFYKNKVDVVVVVE